MKKLPNYWKYARLLQNLHGKPSELSEIYTVIALFAKKSLQIIQNIHGSYVICKESLAKCRKYTLFLYYLQRKPCKMSQIYTVLMYFLLKAEKNP